VLDNFFAHLQELSRPRKEGREAAFDPGFCPKRFGIPLPEDMRMKGSPKPSG
jgi:hypothetical protein